MIIVCPSCAWESWGSTDRAAAALLAKHKCKAKKP